jgi:hypothetical protein
MVINATPKTGAMNDVFTTSCEEFEDSFKFLSKAKRRLSRLINSIVALYNSISNTCPIVFRDATLTKDTFAKKVRERENSCWVKMYFAPFTVLRSDDSVIFFLRILRQKSNSLAQKQTLLTILDVYVDLLGRQQ